MPDAPDTADTPDTPRAARADPAACGACHRAIHGEWQDSAHGRAFTDPIYRKAIARVPRPEQCHGCHAPESVLDRLGKMPRTRTERLDDGITCSSCHEQGGAVHGPFGAETAAHASVKDPVFSDKGSIALCSGCHDKRIADVLPLAKEFAAAGLAEKGKSCAGCHMPEITRPLAVDPATGAPSGPPRPGRSHELLGPADAEFCERAFAFRAERAGDRVLVFVKNRAGHGVPGLAAMREFPVALAVRDASGKALREHRLVFSGDNRLLVEEERRIEIAGAAGAVAVDVAVDHVFQGKIVATVLRRTLHLGR